MKYALLSNVNNLHMDSTAVFSIQFVVENKTPSHCARCTTCTDRRRERGDQASTYQHAVVRVNTDRRVLVLDLHVLHLHGLARSHLLHASVLDVDVEGDVFHARAGQGVPTSAPEAQ